MSDALFIKRLLDKYTEQFLPDVPELDYTKIDVRNAIKSVRDFYTSKGTSFSISYLFKLLYGEEVSVTYPKIRLSNHLHLHGQLICFKSSFSIW